MQGGGTRPGRGVQHGIPAALAEGGGLWIPAPSPPPAGSHDPLIQLPPILRRFFSPSLLAVCQRVHRVIDNGISASVTRLQWGFLPFSHELMSGLSVEKSQRPFPPRAAGPCVPGPTCSPALGHYLAGLLLLRHSLLVADLRLLSAVILFIASSRSSFCLTRTPGPVKVGCSQFRGENSPGGPVARTPRFSLPRARVQSCSGAKTPRHTGTAKKIYNILSVFLVLLLFS